MTKLYHTMVWHGYTIPWYDKVIPYHGMTWVYHTMVWQGYTIPWYDMAVLYSAPPIPAGILRNPQESSGILRNGTGIHRNPQEWHQNPQESSGILRNPQEWDWNGTGIEWNKTRKSIYLRNCSQDWLEERATVDVDYEIETGIAYTDLSDNSTLSQRWCQNGL